MADVADPALGQTEDDSHQENLVKEYSLSRIGFGIREVLPWFESNQEDAQNWRKPPDPARFSLGTVTVILFGVTCLLAARGGVVNTMILVIVALLALIIGIKISECIHIVSQLTANLFIIVSVPFLLITFLPVGSLRIEGSLRLLALSTAVTGIISAWMPTLDSSNIEQAIKFVPAFLFVPGAILAFLLLEHVGIIGVITELASFAGPVWDRLVTPRRTQPHLMSFLWMAAISLLIFRRALNTLPISKLSLYYDVHKVETQFQLVNEALAQLEGAMTMAAVGATSLALAGLLEDLIARPILNTVLRLVTNSAGIRGLFFVLTLLSLGIFVATWIARTVRRLSVRTVIQQGIPISIGALVPVVFLTRNIQSLAWGSLLPVLRASPPSIQRVVLDIGVFGSLLGAFVGTFLFVKFLSIMLLFSTGLGVLPSRAVGIAIASTGMLVATIIDHLGAATSDVTGLGFPLTGVAAAFVIWDLGEYGVGLGEEIGRHSRTLKGEVVHAAASVLIAGVGVVLSLTIMTFATGFSGGNLPESWLLFALSVLIVGLTILITALNG